MYSVSSATLGSTYDFCHMDISLLAMKYCSNAWPVSLFRWTALSESMYCPSINLWCALKLLTLDSPVSIIKRCALSIDSPVSISNSDVEYM